MKVGFTGTQVGATVSQLSSLGALLKVLAPEEFHHGDCIGADAEAHRVAKSLAIPIVIHPPDVNAKRAFCREYAETRRPLPYLERNREVVDETDVMIAMPKDNQEVKRSGTWATVRYAQKADKTTFVIWPDGGITLRY